VSVTGYTYLVGAEQLKRLRQDLDKLVNALASVATDKLRATIVDALPESPFNITKVGGTSLTARDWSQDFAKLQNIDTQLSTRASESTLSSFSGKFPSATSLSDSLDNPTTTILGSALLGFDGTYWRRVRVDTSGRLAIQNPPNFDVATSTLARLFRWGRDVTPTWVHGSEVTAPAAGTTLVSRTVSTGKVGYIYGFFISAGEANDFLIQWVSGGVTYSRMIIFPSKGTLYFADIIPLNEGLPCDSNSKISIKNINAGTGIYEAGIFVGEVET